MYMHMYIHVHVHVYTCTCIFRVIIIPNSSDRMSIPFYLLGTHLHVGVLYVSHLLSISIVIVTCR